MSDEPWLKVSKAFGNKPIVSEVLAEPLNIRVERYICEPLSSSIEPLGVVSMVTQFGGSPVDEGVEDGLHKKYFPSTSAIVPANCATQWQFNGYTDFAVFYFQAQSRQPLCQLIENSCLGLDQPFPITDLLISSVSKQIVEELFHNNGTGEFVERLMLVMLEQALRYLSGGTKAEFKPAYIHLGRIQSSIKFIQSNLDQPLLIDQLAEKVKLSPSHFRRLFADATGMPIHQFVTHLRMTAARGLLTNTAMPLIRIASTLGFNSQSHFTASFKNTHALTPGRFRRLFFSPKTKA